jgi:addiction module HigA family antidote
MSNQRKPAHPGEFFKLTVLDERGLSIASAAEHLGISRKTMSKFANGKARCSSTMARRIAESTGTSVFLWINMQAKLDIWNAENMDKPINIKVLPGTFAGMN